MAKWEPVWGAGSETIAKIHFCLDQPAFETVSSVVLAAEPLSWRRILAASVLGLSLVGAVRLTNQIVFGEAGRPVSG